MKIQGATALVTGANRGFGRHLAQQLRDRGAKVYAGARNSGSVDLRVRPPKRPGSDGPEPLAPGRK